MGTRVIEVCDWCGTEVEDGLWFTDEGEELCEDCFMDWQEAQAEEKKNDQTA